MSKIALVVEFKVVPEHKEAFCTLMRSHAKAALDHEPGCLQFDVMVSREDATRVFLYEIYADQKALDEHMASPQLARTRGSYAHMIAERRVVICNVI